MNCSQELIIEIVFKHSSGECVDVKCKSILEGLETIDDELDGIRVSFVQTRDEDYLFKTHEVETLPALGLYRNKNFLVSFNVLESCNWYTFEHRIIWSFQNLAKIV